MELKDRIKQLRLEKNLTQQQFGDLFNLKKSTISMYETGKSKPYDELKIKIADYFNVSLDYLMGRTDIRIDKVYNNQRAKSISLDGLPDNAVKQVEEYVEFMKEKYIEKTTNVKYRINKK